ncbi:hypothetical protein HYX05_02445 [Candidatus Woesearchaeota archaeon]|nr:hypothetical protein [Candidatus Woesearchaeota archaeon]
MKVFLAGQIQERYRGDLAVVVTREATKGPYGVFLYPINSDEFATLTGFRTITSPVERAYVGVSHQGGELITRKNDELNEGRTTLDSLDALLVLPYFLGQQSGASSQSQQSEPVSAPEFTAHWNA